MVIDHLIFEETPVFRENIFNVFIHLVNSFFQFLCMLFFSNKGNLHKDEDFLVGCIGVIKLHRDPKPPAELRAQNLESLVWWATEEDRASSEESLTCDSQSDSLQLPELLPV